MNEMNKTMNTIHNRPSSSGELDTFIKEFDLRLPDGSIRFIANIRFENKDNQKSLQIEVHIITSIELATIYLLDPEIDSYELPDIFTEKDQQFTYIGNQYLKIEGKNGIGNYTILIIPVQNLV